MVLFFRFTHTFIGIGMNSKESELNLGGAFMVPPKFAFTYFSELKFNMRSNFRHIVLIFSGLLFSGLLFSQTIKKNSFFINATPTYAKSNFTNLNDLNSDWLLRLYESEKPTKGILGYYIGVGYKRALVSNWNLGIGVSYSINGQQSPDFFKIKGISMQDLESLPDYGGTSYRIVYKSYESHILVEYVYKKKGKFSFSVLTGGAFNVYYRVEAERFMISKASGKKGSGGVHETFFNASKDRVIDDLKRHISLGLWRLGFFAGWSLEYRVHPLFSINAAPTIRYYTNLHDTSVAKSVVEGGIVNIGCQIGLNLNF